MGIKTSSGLVVAVGLVSARSILKVPEICPRLEYSGGGSGGASKGAMTTGDSIGLGTLVEADSTGGCVAVCGSVQGGTGNTAQVGSPAEDNESIDEMSEVPTSEGTDGQVDWMDSAMKN